MTTVQNNTVLAIGELLIDFISDDYHANLSEARSFNMFQGGSPANFCANLKWLNTPARLMAAVGNDGPGKFLLNQIGSIGIDTKDIHIHQNLPTSLVLVAKSKGTPDFLAYRMADRFIHLSSMEWLNEVNIVHTSAFALSMEPARTIILDALKQAKAEGLTISIDWNFAPEIWSNGGGEKVFDEILALNPLLKISIDDYQRFLGSNQNAVEAAKDFLEKYNLNFCCLTYGADGVWFKESNANWIHQSSLPVSKVMDTTGAGDAFWAGFIAEWLKSRSAKAAVENGLSIAAQKVSKIGPLYIE